MVTEVRATRAVPGVSRTSPACFLSVSQSPKTTEHVAVRGPPNSTQGKDPLTRRRWFVRRGGIYDSELFGSRLAQERQSGLMVTEVRTAPVVLDSSHLHRGRQVLLPVRHSSPGMTICLAALGFQRRFAAVMVPASGLRTTRPSPRLGRRETARSARHPSAAGRGKSTHRRSEESGDCARGPPNAAGMCTADHGRAKAQPTTRAQRGRSPCRGKSFAPASAPGGCRGAVRFPHCLRGAKFGDHRARLLFEREPGAEEDRARCSARSRVQRKERRRRPGVGGSCAEEQSARSGRSAPPDHHRVGMAICLTALGPTHVTPGGRRSGLLSGSAS